MSGSGRTMNNHTSNKITNIETIKHIFNCENAGIDCNSYVFALAKVARVANEIDQYLKKSDKNIIVGESNLHKKLYERLNKLTDFYETYKTKEEKKNDQ